MKTARLPNVYIRDLIFILTKLATRYEVVDLIIDPDNKTIIIDPIDRVQGEIEITDDNIYSLV